MFTGLIGDVGVVAELASDPAGAQLAITTDIAHELRPGDSIAVNGVCLTATTVAEGGFAADVMRETLERSSLGAATAGTRVNLELPLRAGERLGGHVVQGHVDGIGSVESVREEGFARILTVGSEPAILRYVASKGSIALDGVSLTVAEVAEESFTVSLIPETLERTNLGLGPVGRSVNLEVDILAKYVERLIRA